MAIGIQQKAYSDYIIHIWPLFYGNCLFINIWRNRPINDKTIAMYNYTSSKNILSFVFTSVSAICIYAGMTV